MYHYDEVGVLATKKAISKFLEFIILKNLQSADYIYKIRRFIKEKYHVNLNCSRIRDVLVALEKKGILESELEPSAYCKFEKRVYHLTFKGKSYFETLEIMLKFIL